MYKYVYTFLEQERPKMDSFERKKKFGCKGKILRKIIRKNALLALYSQSEHNCFFGKGI